MIERSADHLTEASGRSRLRYALFVAAMIALGVWLRREALFMGFVADDYAQLGMVQGHYLLPRSPFNLFNFSDGSVEEGRRLLEGGFYHWWSHPELRLSMLRPLASAMIWLDFQLFGDNALAHHLHSLVWWIGFLVVVACVFARFLPLKVAGLAFALLLLDEAHGVSLAWIANRSVFVSSVLVLGALLYYPRYCRSTTLRGGLSIFALVGLALGFGEYALCGIGFLVAYDLLMEGGTPRERLSRLWPVLVPAATFLLLRAVLGHEPRHSGVYVGLADPAELARAVVTRLPVLYADFLLAIRAEYWTFGAPWTFALVERGLVPSSWLVSLDPWRAVHQGIGAVAILLVAALYLATPARGELRHLRWLALAGALATLPVVSSFPSSRLLVVALVGLAPVLSGFIIDALSQLREGLRARPGRTAARAALALLLLGWHSSVPVALARSEMTGLYEASQSVRAAVLGMEADPARLPEQRVVVLNAAEDGTSMYIPLTRKHHGLPAPKRCWTLSRAPSPYSLQRDGPISLVIRFFGGFSMLVTAPEQLLRTPRAGFSAGDVVDVDGMRATVLELHEGRPVAVRFEFDVPLEHPSLLFVQPTLRGIVRVPMPEVGAAILVPAPVIPPRRPSELEGGP